MKHTEADYINAGYKYESAKTPDGARAVAQRIRKMLDEETIEEQHDARYLIERGRQEARSEAHSR